MEKSYITTTRESTYTFTEKKSEFIGRVFPIKSEEECHQILSTVRKQHYDATHNCFGYTLGASMEVQRSSDDGEPSGTAGLPILDVLRKGQITNTLIVVTRYFGGILLGSGGLIRAYSHAASESLKEAGLVKIAPSCVYQLDCDYSVLERLKYELPRRGFTILDIGFSEIASIQVTSPEDQAGSPEELLAEISGGKGRLHEIGIMHVSIPLE